MIIRLFSTACLLFLCAACGGSSEDASSTTASSTTASSTTTPGAASDSIASAAPGTDVYLAPLEQAGDALRLGTPQNATQRAGYDNQPAFTMEGGAFVYTAVQGSQTEVMRYDLDAQATRALSDTPQSEYSPTPRPDDRMTLIRVEDDGRQRLWQYSALGLPAAPVFATLSPVGYHAWLDSARVGMFVLGDPPTLRLGNARTDSVRTLTERIGRSLQSIPDANAISFVKIAPDSTTTIHRLNPEGTTELLTSTPGDERGIDHAWTPEGTLLMGRGTVLYAWRPDGGGWRAVADVAPLQPTRLSVAPGGQRLAFVAQDTPPSSALQSSAP
jgi:hypothetical protein